MPKLQILNFWVTEFSYFWREELGAIIEWQDVFILNFVSFKVIKKCQAEI
jgi:hypothetical protein